MRHENRRGDGNDAPMEITKRFPQPLGNLAQNARFPHSHSPSSFSLRKKQSGQIICQTGADRSLVNNSRQWHTWFRFARTPRHPRISVVPWLAELTEELT